MIGELPKALNIAGSSYDINSDFRVMLRIYEAFGDPELTDREKLYICMKLLYADYESIPREHFQEAAEKAYWFAGGGDMPQSSSGAKVMDWVQDQQLYFPAVNKAVGYEVRAVTYMHWWSFIGAFSEIGEGLFSQVINIRSKKAHGKKLEKYEQDFYSRHRELIELKRKYTKEEAAERERLNKLLG